MAGVVLEESFRQQAVSAMFVELAGGLSEYAWSKQRIWQNRIAAFEFDQTPRCRIAFDVFVDPDGRVRLHVVSRDPEHGPDLRQLLLEAERESRPARGNGARFEIPLQAMVNYNGDIAESSKEVCHAISDIRKLMSQWPGPLTCWDSDKGISIRYAERSERKSSKQLLVVFSSIRTKSSWMDFGGPFGDPFKGIRGRILFVADDAGQEYCYHLRKNGSDAVELATLDFLKHYIALHGIKRGNVVLCGMSKGATAAICLGAKLPGVSVLALVPQLQLGTYLEQRKDGIFRQMFGVGPDPASVNRANKLVPERLTAFLKAGGDAVVMTSEADKNCFDVVSERSIEWDEYTNFRPIIFDSPEATDHFSTLGYGVPAFLAWLSFFSLGLWSRTLGDMPPVL